MSNTSRFWLVGLVVLLVYLILYPTPNFYAWHVVYGVLIAATSFILSREVLFRNVKTPKDEGEG